MSTHWTNTPTFLGLSVGEVLGVGGAGLLALALALVLWWYVIKR